MEAINQGLPKRQRIKDGTRFGNLVCMGKSKTSGKGGNAKYIMKCDCGKEIAVLGLSLKDGTKTSCNQPNCIYSEHIRHGMSSSYEYNVWRCMIQRCTNPNNTSYAYYGGRGIKVHSDWVSNFWNFYSHVGASPSEKHTLDRIDTNGNYEPGNVQWVLWSEQVNNRRTVNELSARIKYLEAILDAAEIEY